MTTPSSPRPRNVVLICVDRPEGFVTDGALTPGRPVAPVLPGLCDAV